MVDNLRMGLEKSCYELSKGTLLPNAVRPRIYGHLYYDATINWEWLGRFGV